MFYKIVLPVRYLIYLLIAKSKHGIHSPFVFEFVTQVLYNNRQYPDYDAIEGIRKQLLHNNNIIVVNDHGTGNSGNRKISAIARKSLKNKKFGQLLYRIAQHYKPSNVTELGTSFGISTLYLAKGNPKNSIITIEGSERVAEIAQKNFNYAKADNIKLHTGSFDSMLPELHYFNESVGLVFFDGNHTKQSTLEYFNHFLPAADKDSIFIFDDIRWSREMLEAWEIIKKHPKATITIDLFFMGIVFFREKQAKEHFLIRF